MSFQATQALNQRSYVMRGPHAEKSLDTYHLILAPSYACNLRCRHCYLPDHDSRGLSEKRVLELIDEWAQIVAEERGPYGGIFHLKGGEPLILPYFDEVLERIKKHESLEFMLTTNGISQGNATIQNICALNDRLDGHVTIIVSLDGSNEEVNSQLRGSGNFRPAVDFVRRLTTSGVNVFLNNVIHKGNVHQVESFAQLALDLGVTQINFLSFVPKGYGAEMSFARPDPVEVFERIHQLWDKSPEDMRHLLAGSFSDILRAESCGTCTSAECVGGYRGLLYIVPDGTAYSCPNLNYEGLEAGNILHDSLSTIHNSLVETVYKKIITQEGDITDKYLCKGEKFNSASQDYVVNQHPALQLLLGSESRSRGTSYCYSRNF